MKKSKFWLPIVVILIPIILAVALGESNLFLGYVSRTPARGVRVCAANEITINPGRIGNATLDILKKNQILGNFSVSAPEDCQVEIRTFRILWGPAEMSDFENEQFHVNLANVVVYPTSYYNQRYTSHDSAMCLQKNNPEAELTFIPLATWLYVPAGETQAFAIKGNMTMDKNDNKIPSQYSQQQSTVPSQAVDTPVNPEYRLSAGIGRRMEIVDIGDRKFTYGGKAVHQAKVKDTCE